jgi:hypothetical protein
MPIRLNLLAEAQASEEMRRRDPVKRAIWATALAVALMLAWSSSLQLRAIRANSDLSRVTARVSLSANSYRRVLENQRKTAEMEEKLAALSRMVTNRFLFGSVLNALQQTTVEDVHLVRLKAEQSYVLIEPTKGRTNGNNVISGKPGSVTEKILLTLEGVDSSSSPGEQVNRLIEALGTNAYFRSVLTRTNPVSLKNLSSPQVSPADGKPSVMFTLECRCLEKTR